ncbi:hypothetical protein FIBSPDRAFT_942400 [Athelia psychrophila]|uniref:Uncharacterized protein n=1 Tax=Athelia psychrophila TaxID=1759441 RepID=A0A166WYV8_9AGAM|nr:hypothetical protein FIBSPDRAFT_942400 [Fibularhizoctonia sp. CBS 109695]
MHAHAVFAAPGHHPSAYAVIPPLADTTDKHRDGSLVRLREPSQTPSAHASMRARLAVRGYETRNILSAAPSRRMGLSEDQEWTRARSVQRRDGHDEAAGRCGCMHDGAFHPKCECMCMSGVTLINFVVDAAAGSLWPTPSHKRPGRPAPKGSGGGGRHGRDMPSRICCTRERDGGGGYACSLALVVVIAVGWSKRGILCPWSTFHGSQSTDGNHPNRCQRDAEEDAWNGAPVANINEPPDQLLSPLRGTGLGVDMSTNRPARPPARHHGARCAQKKEIGGWSPTRWS